MYMCKTVLEKYAIVNKDDEDIVDGMYVSVHVLEWTCFMCMCKAVLEKYAM